MNMGVNFFTEGINASGPINIEKNTSKKQITIYLVFVHGIEPRAYYTELCPNWFLLVFPRECVCVCARVLGRWICSEACLLG